LPHEDFPKSRRREHWILGVTEREYVGGIGQQEVGSQRLEVSLWMWVAGLASWVRDLAVSCTWSYAQKTPMLDLIL
jgi:hypothetical protein